MGNAAKNLAEAKTGAEIAAYLEWEIRPLLEWGPSPLVVASGEFNSADWDRDPWSESVGLHLTRQGCLRAIARGLELGLRDPPADPGAAADEPRLELFLAEVLAWLRRDSLSNEPDAPPDGPDRAGGCFWWKGQQKSLDMPPQQWDLLVFLWGNRPTAPVSAALEALGKRRNSGYSAVAPIVNRINQALGKKGLPFLWQKPRQAETITYVCGH